MFNYLLTGGRNGVIEVDMIRKDAAVAGKYGKGKRRTILLIDDDEDIVRFMEVLLSDKYHVMAASSGVDGLHRVYRDKPDLILLDLLMNDIDGYEISRKVKSDENTRDIPIILFTAKSRKSEIDEGLKAGADDYLTKPFSNKDLFSKLDRYLAAEK